MQFHHVRHPHPYRPAADLSGFYVIAVISNPARFQRRYELYWTFLEMCQAAEVTVVTVELALGERPFMVTEQGNPLHVRLRTIEELWHKENMINLGVARACQLHTLDPQRFKPAREVAWVDADCRSARHPRLWFEETWHALQHYECVQMWESMIDLDLDTNCLGAPMPSFMRNYVKFGTPNPDAVKLHKLHYPTGHKSMGRPGLAWACNVDAWHKVGGLIDFCILGANDWYQAYSLIGALESVIRVREATKVPGPMERKLLHWERRAEHHIKRDVGFVPGLVYHDFHGPKSARGYATRGEILTRNQFNPDTDIKYDAQGLLQLESYEPRQFRLRDEIRAYFKARNEDATS
jgi:hypothetical protein